MLDFLRRIWHVGRRSGINNPRVWDDLLDTCRAESGETVNADSMLSVPAVWQAVGMISGDVSKLPLEVYKRAGKDREPDTAHPARWIIRPDCWANPETSALVLWRRAVVHALVWPRAYVWIDRDAGGRPVGLYNLLPDRTSIEEVDGRRVVVSEIGGRLYPFQPRDTLMLENISVSESETFGPLKAARNNVGLQLAKRKFQSRFYSHGCHAGGILQVPPGASDKATKKVQESVDKHRSGNDESFRALVLRDGFKWHQVTVNPDDAQGSETEEAEVRNVARFYRMAPSRLGCKESISYNSEEAARRAYHDETLSYWLTQIRTECSLKLLTQVQYDRDTHFVDYNIHALNWADTTTVISVGVQGVMNGIFNRDEVRRWFNLGPLPAGAGEVFLQALNMGVVGAGAAAPAADQQRATVTAWRTLAIATLERAAGRLGTEARRPVADGGTETALRAMWAPVGMMGAALGLGEYDAVGRLLGDWRSGYAAAAAAAAGGQAEFAERFKRETPAAIVAESFPGNTEG